MASASDVRAILSLPPPSIPANAQPHRKQSGPSTRKPDGISRELYSLIGDSAPTLAAQYARPKFKPKLDFGKKESAKWIRSSFTNPRRKDNLMLSHWVKAGLPEEDHESAFARYNTPSAVFDYSSEDYVRLLQDPDKDWSQEETDYLFSIAREYDLRFLVMADRYDFPSGKPRQIEDLKARYYGVCRKLIRDRQWPGDEISKNQVLATYSFDKEQERNRKTYLNGLFDRTPEQIAEEETLYVEIKRLEQNERRYAKERDDLLRTVGGIESGLAGLRVDPDVLLGVPSDKKKKMKRLDGEYIPDSPLAAPGASINTLGIGASFGQRKRDNFKQAASDVQHCITRYDPPPTTGNKSSTPVHLRSLRSIPASNPKAHVAKLLNEHGVHPTRLVMPTKSNVERLEALQGAAGSLLDMKKTVDRVEQEIRTITAQLKLAMGGGAEDGEGEEDEEMAEAGPSQTKAQQAQKRSMSVSSGTPGVDVERFKRRKTQGRG